MMYLGHQVRYFFINIKTTEGALHYFVMYVLNITFTKINKRVLETGKVLRSVCTDILI
jgi:hypothetical protein